MSDTNLTLTYAWNCVSRIIDDISHIQKSLDSLTNSLKILAGHIATISIIIKEAKSNE